MGVDAKIAVRGDMDDAQLEALTIALRTRFNRKEFFIYGEDKDNLDAPLLSADEDSVEEPSVLHLRWYARHYGPGYERGDWPKMAAMLECVRKNIPASCACLYGTDSHDTWTLVDDGFMREQWYHWASKEGNSYYGGPPCLACKAPVFINTWMGGRSFGTCDHCGSKWEAAVAGHEPGKPWKERHSIVGPIAYKSIEEQIREDAAARAAPSPHPAKGAMSDE